MADSSRISSLEPLRGLAAFAVMWFHFTAANSHFPPGLLKSSGTYGNLGVTVFFVISGFVIPYSLWRGSYRLRRDAFTFVAKRAVRLHPPYIVSLLIFIALALAAALAPGFRGVPLKLDAANLLANFFYLCGILGEPWLNGVAWTLAIECQWYLLAAILQPLFINKRTRFFAPIALAACALMVPADFAAKEIWIVRSLPIFAVGVMSFQWRAHLISGKWGCVAVMSALAICYISNGLPQVAAASATVLAILFLRMPATGMLGFLGAVSYSVYLLHVPFGSRIVNLGTRFAQTPLSLSIVLAAAVAVSLFTAWLLYYFVEKPAARWSSQLKYAASRPVQPILTTPEPLVVNEV